MTPEELRLKKVQFLDRYPPANMDQKIDLTDGQNITFDLGGGDTMTIREIIDHCRTCVMEGTLILMADGTEKPVEQVKAGDMVKSFDPKTEEFMDSVVWFCDKTGEHQRDWKCNVWDDGTYLCTYGWHKVYVHNDIGGYVSRNLHKDAFVGMVNIRADGEEVHYCGNRSFCSSVKKQAWDIQTATGFYINNGIVCGGGLLAMSDNFDRRHIVLPDILKAPFDFAKINADSFTNDPEYIAETVQLNYQKNLAWSQICKDKKELADTDYKNNKHQQGVLTDEEYAEFTDKCETLRSRINTNQALFDEAKAAIAEVDKKYQTIDIPSTKARYLEAHHQICLHEADWERFFAALRNKQYYIYNGKVYVKFSAE